MDRITAAQETPEGFLAVAADFRLGELETEQPHPLTVNLSNLAVEDLPAAHRLLKAVDLAALQRVAGEANPVPSTSLSREQLERNGGRVFLSGCGATGRLSLALETLGRQGMLPPSWQERVIGFMAGGDAALIRSIEGFEDRPDHAERQMRELGFGPKDLLIAATEGGETPWVIGTAEYAAKHSELSPIFTYTNPDSLLRATVERSARVLDNPAITKWNLSAGPMALAGSTRMQSSTVLMLAGGHLLLGLSGDETPFADRLARFTAYLNSLDYAAFSPLTEKESHAAARGLTTFYQSRDFGLSVLTDTTERSPTFSLPPFPNRLAPGDPASLSFLKVSGTQSSQEAWNALLRRPLRCLDWRETQKWTGTEWLLGYDLAAHASAPESFVIGRADNELIFHLGQARAHFPTSQQHAVSPGEQILFDNLAVKCLLNAHSTLVMGRIGRYSGNLMTYVRASNLKLIDRAIRYVAILAERETGVRPCYEQICHCLFEAKKTLQPDEPIVLKTLLALTA
jgi:N-acetylmuramic acid 6-phosphate etherase